MCSKTIILRDGTEIACRRCNDCLAAKINDWVARAMAEKATSHETLVFGLTYRNDKNGKIPARAKVFHYTDIQLFIKKIRQQYLRTYSESGEIRYIVAGELGSDNDRAHWHMVIFADRPISKLGTWETIGFVPQEDGMRLNKNQIWSMWPHGMLRPQEPNQGGMRYALKYALKDQFNIVKAKGTMREARAQVHAAGYFRMSKIPPLGQRYLEKQLQRWCELGSVPPALQVIIPDLKGFWWPKGQLREYLLDGLHEINEKIKRTTGRPAPQWNTLISTVMSDKCEKDWEGLQYGYQAQTTEEANHEAERFEKARPAIENDQQQAANAASIRGRCGGVRPCVACWRGKGPSEKADYLKWYRQHAKENGGADQETLEERWRDKNQINPFCTFKDAPAQEKAFYARVVNGKFEFK